MKKLTLQIVTLIIFLVITGVSLGYIMTPAVEHVMSPTQGDYEKPYLPFVLGGNNMLYEAWTTYPEYNIGMGIITGFGFAGMIVSIISISRNEKISN